MLGRQHNRVDVIMDMRRFGAQHIPLQNLWLPAPGLSCKAQRQARVKRTWACWVPVADMPGQPMKERPPSSVLVSGFDRSCVPLCHAHRKIELQLVITFASKIFRIHRLGCRGLLLKMLKGKYHLLGHPLLLMLLLDG